MKELTIDFGQSKRYTSKYGQVFRFKNDIVYYSSVKDFLDEYGSDTLTKETAKDYGIILDPSNEVEGVVIKAGTKAKIVSDCGSSCFIRLNDKLDTKFRIYNRVEAYPIVAKKIIHFGPIKYKFVELN